MTDAAQIVTVTLAGRTFKCSRRTAAHIEYTIERLAAEYVGAELIIIQPSFNVGVVASAGTHDKDACFDVQITHMEWLLMQRFLRRCGWAAWYRTPAQGFTPHIHMVSLGYPGGPSAVGIYVPGQVDDYYRHALGLKGQHDSGADSSWFPPDIAATVFDYDAWKDAHMPLTKDDLDAIEARLTPVIKTTVAAEFTKEQKNGRTLRENVLAIAKKLGVTPAKE